MTDQATGLSIAFSREELVVLAELCDLRLPTLLGERPLPGLTGVSRQAVLDVATRSLLARGVLVREGDNVALVRAATGLLEIVSASSLRVEVIVDEAGVRTWHTIHAIPYAAVDTSIDVNGNHRFAPFATEDLLLHVGQLTGLIDAQAPATHDLTSDDGAGAELGLPEASTTFGAWRAARSLVRDGADADAVSTLVDGGVAEGSARTLVDVLRDTSRGAAVQIVHHPSPTTSAGGEVAWLDAGERGIWVVPAVDQPFGRLPRGDEDVRSMGDALALEPSTGDRELDGLPATITPITKAALLRDLHSVLPEPG